MPRWLPAAACLLALPILAPAAAGAASFVLDTGEVVDGRLVAATRNTVTVLREIGGIRQIPVQRVERIRIESGSTTLAGAVEKVEDGKILIATTDGGTVWLDGDQVVAADEPVRAKVDAVEVTRAEPAAGPGATASPQPASPKQAAEGRTTSAPALADIGPRPQARGLAPGRSFGGLVPQAAAAATKGEAAEDGPAAAPPLIRIEVVSPEIGEQDGKVDFRVELSRASDQPVHLVYSTVDGQAKAGQDYEANQGVLTLAPGELSHVLETKVLDDRDREEPEHFFLFVTTDAKQAAIEEKWHSVTIRDDD